LEAVAADTAPVLAPGSFGFASADAFAFASGASGWSVPGFITFIIPQF
jgi:hypothetical protein